MASVWFLYNFKVNNYKTTNQNVVWSVIPLNPVYACDHKCMLCQCCVCSYPYAQQNSILYWVSWFRPATTQIQPSSIQSIRATLTYRCCPPQQAPRSNPLYCTSLAQILASLFLLYVLLRHIVVITFHARSNACITSLYNGDSSCNLVPVLSSLNISSSSALHHFSISLTQPL